MKYIKILSIYFLFLISVLCFGFAERSFAEQNSGVIKNVEYINVFNNDIISNNLLSIENHQQKDLHYPVLTFVAPQSYYKLFCSDFNNYPYNIIDSSENNFLRNHLYPRAP